MWIRSQDKTELIKANRVQVDGDSVYVFNNDWEEGYLKVGKYDSEERAIEVLDNIQMQLGRTSTFYVMPEK